MNRPLLQIGSQEAHCDVEGGRKFCQRFSLSFLCRAAMAYQRLVKSDVKYRFVIDMASLESE